MAQKFNQLRVGENVSGLSAGLFANGASFTENIDVSASLQQAKRYSRGFKTLNETTSPGGPWGEYKLPFAFSSNARPFLRQLATRSGTWFADLRNPA